MHDTISVDPHHSLLRARDTPELHYCRKCRPDPCWRWQRHGVVIVTGI